MTLNAFTIIGISCTFALCVIAAIVAYRLLRKPIDDTLDYDEEYDDYEEEEYYPNQIQTRRDEFYDYDNNRMDILEYKLRQATRLNVSLFNLLMDIIDSPQNEGTRRYHHLRAANTALSMDIDPDIRGIYNAVKHRVTTDTITCYLAMLLDKYGGATTLTPDVYRSYVRNFNVVVYCQEQINRVENFDFHSPELEKTIEETDRAYEKMCHEEPAPQWTCNPVQRDPEPTYVPYDEMLVQQEEPEEEEDIASEGIDEVEYSTGPVNTLKASFKLLFSKYQGSMADI